MYRPAFGMIIGSILFVPAQPLSLQLVFNTLRFFLFYYHLLNTEF